jgi:hypothetical protein
LEARIAPAISGMRCHLNIAEVYLRLLFEAVISRQLFGDLCEYGCHVVGPVQAEKVVVVSVFVVDIRGRGAMAGVIG